MKKTITSATIPFCRRHLEFSKKQRRGSSAVKRKSSRVPIFSQDLCVFLTLGETKEREEGRPEEVRGAVRVHAYDAGGGGGHGVWVRCRRTEDARGFVCVCPHLARQVRVVCGVWCVVLLCVCLTHSLPTRPPSALLPSSSSRRCPRLGLGLGLGLGGVSA